MSAPAVGPAPVEDVQEETGSESEASSDDASNATGDNAADDLICGRCGSVLCVEGDVSESNGAHSPPAKRARAESTSTTSKAPTVKLGPRMLRLHAVRRATRVAMLAAIPGCTPRVAARIVAEFPTFADIVDAGVAGVASVQVTKYTEVTHDRAMAIIRALQ